MDYVMGIDQGASNTRVAVASLDGRVLGVGRAGGGYHAITGMNHALDRMREASGIALAAAGLERDSALVAVGAGLTGADFADEYLLLSDEVAACFGAPTQVTNDSMAALRAEDDSHNALVICAGSGVNICLRSPGGRDFIFGYLIDDNAQGGFAIARAALRMVLDAEAGASMPTILTGKLLDFYGVASVEALMRGWFLGGLDKRRLKDFSIEVDRCACQNDVVALSILQKFAKDAARYAIAGLTRYEMLTTSPAVVLAGSVFQSELSLLLETIASEIHMYCSGAKVRLATHEPVVGGVVLALEKATGKDITHACYARLSESAKEHGLVPQSKT